MAGSPFFDAVRATDALSIKAHMDSRGLVPVWDYAIAEAMKGHPAHEIARKAIGWKTAIDAREIIYMKTGCLAKKDMSGPTVPDPKTPMTEAERSERVRALETELSLLREATMAPAPPDAEAKAGPPETDAPESPAGEDDLDSHGEQADEGGPGSREPMGGDVDGGLAPLSMED